MSYILEALKKSQHDRELGRVPQVQAAPFQELEGPAHSQPWAQTAIGLALIAVALAAYAALRPVAPEQPALQTSEGRESETTMAAAAAEEAGTSGRVSPEAAGRNPALARDGSPSEGAAAAGEDAQSLLTADGEDVPVVEPQVLVVPAAPKPGESLPRGADELRRALLGPDAAAAFEPPQPRPVREAPKPDYAPAPPDLIAEIEQFKRSVQAGEGAAFGNEEGAGTTTEAGIEDDNAVAKASRSDTPVRGRESREAGRRAPAPSSAAVDEAAERPPALTSALRRRLPPFSMTVHVYDPDPTRRFVYLNGNKAREGELTRDGFLVEQVVMDGAVFRYDEYRFFQAP